MTQSKNIFTQQENIDLEGATSLKEVAGHTFYLDYISCRYSEKHESVFTILRMVKDPNYTIDPENPQDKKDTLYYTWSKVINDKIKKLEEQPEQDWKREIALLVQEKKSKNGYKYLDLVLDG